MEEENGRVFVPLEEATLRLPEGDDIHTFRNPCGMLVGANWRREQVLEALQTADKIEETGGVAQRMGHGLMIMHGGSPLFIEARGPA